MLIVRDAQLEAMRRSLTDAFRQRAFKHLKALLSQSDGARHQMPWTDDALTAAIDRALAQCQQFHLRSEADVIRYLEIVCAHLPGYADQTYPVQALQILLAYGVEPARKLGQLSDTLRRGNVVVMSVYIIYIGAVRRGLAGAQTRPHSRMLPYGCCRRRSRARHCNLATGGTISLDGFEFKLLQFHFHTPPIELSTAQLAPFTKLYIINAHGESAPEWPQGDGGQPIEPDGLTSPYSHQASACTDIVCKHPLEITA